MTPTDDERETAVSKANDHAIEALKQLLTLSGAILALTMTFLKDALGDARGQAVHRWLVPVGWAMLLIVIWTACIAIAHAARAIGRGEVTGYVFASGKQRGLAKIAQWSFAGGLTSLGLFAMINFPLFFVSPGPPCPTARRCTPEPAPPTPESTPSTLARPDTKGSNDPERAPDDHGRIDESSDQNASAFEKAVEKSQDAAGRAEAAATVASNAAQRAQTAAQGAERILGTLIRK